MLVPLPALTFTAILCGLLSASDFENFFLPKSHSSPPPPPPPPFAQVSAVRRAAAASVRVRSLAPSPLAPARVALQRVRSRVAALLLDWRNYDFATKSAFSLVKSAAIKVEGT